MCRPHLQALWRRFAGMGLKRFYHSDPELGALLRMAMALPYVPADKLQDGMQLLRQEQLLGMCVKTLS